MKFYSCFILFGILCVSVSCSLEDHDFKPENLLGTWEFSSYMQELELVNVNSFVFNSDGTFENSIKARKQDNNLDIGFHSVLSGTYVVNGNQVTLNETKYLILPDGNDQWYVSRNDLSELQWNRESEVTVTLRDRQKEMVFDYGPCSSFVSTMCIETMTFYKVGPKR
jgi:hypothetical protein